MRVPSSLFGLLLAVGFSAVDGTLFEQPLDSSDWRLFSNRNTSEWPLPGFPQYYFTFFFYFVTTLVHLFLGINGTARVPGGVFADLLANSVLKDDPLRRYNDVEYRWVSEDDWTYSVRFDGDYASDISILYIHWLRYIIIITVVWTTVMRRNRESFKMNTRAHESRAKEIP